MHERVGFSGGVVQYVWMLVLGGRVVRARDRVLLLQPMSR